MITRSELSSIQRNLDYTVQGFTQDLPESPIRLNVKSEGECCRTLRTSNCPTIFSIKK